MSGASYCDQHPQEAKRYDRQRGTSAQRGYDYRWQKASKVFLRRNPLCVYCQRDGHVVPSTVVDHKIPHRGDQVLFWDELNWQTLCQYHHSSDKQIEEKGGESRARFDSSGKVIW